MPRRPSPPRTVISRISALYRIGSTVRQLGGEATSVASLMECAPPVFGRGGVAIAALEVEVPELPADLEVAKAALGVAAARSLSRQITVDRHRGQPRLRRLPDPAGGVAVLPVAGG